MKRLLAYVPLILFVLLSGCANEARQETSQAKNVQADNIESNLSNQVDNAQLYSVIFSRNEEALYQIANDLIVSKYDNSIRPENQNWEWYAVENDVPIAALSCDDNWTLSYTDREHDVNGTHGEMDKMIVYGYITDIVPVGLNFSGEEAGEKVCSFLEQYTDVLAFEAYRVLAENLEDETQSGYYTVFAQALFEGIPMTLDGSPDWVTANVGENGLFSLDGSFLLKEISRTEVENTVSADEVYDHLMSYYKELTGADLVEIENVELQYYVETTSDGSYTMNPVWAFTGSVTFSDEEYTTTATASILYYVENGMICDVVYSGL
jgi:hypothetical protein